MARWSAVPGWRKMIQRALIDLLAFVIDASLGIIIFGAFVVISWMMRQAVRTGAKEAYVEVFESAHFWLSVGLYISMGLTIIVRVFRRIFRSGDEL